MQKKKIHFFPARNLVDTTISIQYSLFFPAGLQDFKKPTSKKPERSLRLRYPLFITGTRYEGPLSIS